MVVAAEAAAQLGGGLLPFLTKPRRPSPRPSPTAGGGAWQSAFQACDTPAGPVHALLLQLPADDGAPQALAAIVKAPGNQWLGEATTRRDFYFDLAALPRSAPLLSPDALKAIEEALSKGELVDTDAPPRTGAAADALALAQKVLAMPEPPAPLSAVELARSPPPRGGGGGGGGAVAAVAAAQEKRRSEAKRKGAPQLPELPPPWAEGPPRDKTQVVTLAGDQLKAAAVRRLTEWVAGHEDLVPLNTPEVRLWSWQLERGRQ